MLISGTIRTFGIIYVELLKTSNEGAGNTAFIGSLLLFFMAITGPVSGFISVNYSFRLCTVAGGFFACFGMITSSFAYSIDVLYFTYSFLIGVGFGLSGTPTMTIINFYFEKRRGFASSLMTASMGLSSLTYPILYRTLIDTYGINGAMLVLGGILLNICVGGSLYRQPKCFISDRRKKEMSHADNTTDIVHYSNAVPLQSIGQKIVETLRQYAAYCKNKFFLFNALAISLATVGYSTNFVILPPHMEHQGFNKSDVVLVLSVIGGTEFLIRLFSGHLLDLKLFTVHTMFIVTMFSGGICAIVYTFFTDNIINIVYGLTVGIFPGSLHYMMPLLLVSILGLQSLPTSFPLCLLITHSAALIGHPLMGWLEDLTGEWTASFYALGGVLVASSICVIVERKLWALQHNATTEPRSVLKEGTSEEEKNNGVDDSEATVMLENETT